MHKRIEELVEWVKNNKSKTIIGISGFVLICSIGAIVPMYLYYSNNQLIDDSYTDKINAEDKEESTIITISNIDDTLSLKKDSDELFTGTDVKEFYNNLYDILKEDNSIDYMFQYNNGSYLMDCAVLYSTDMITIKLVNNKELLVKANEAIVEQDSAEDYSSVIAKLEEQKEKFKESNKNSTEKTSNSIIEFAESYVDKPSDEVAKSEEDTTAESEQKEETSTSNNDNQNNSTTTTTSTNNSNSGSSSTQNNQSKPSKPTGSGNGSSSGSNNSNPTPNPTPTPTPTPDPEPTPTPPTPEPEPTPQRTWEYMSSMSDELFGLLNNYRVSNGLSALTYDSSIQEKARARAEYNAENETSGHDYYQISITTGLDSTPQEFLQCWINSPDHNNYMLNSLLTRGGVAIYKDSNDYYYIVAGLATDW